MNVEIDRPTYLNRYIGGPQDGFEVFASRPYSAQWLGDPRADGKRALYAAHGDPEPSPPPADDSCSCTRHEFVVRLTYRGTAGREELIEFAGKNGMSVHFTPGC
jgi:hypothetical protein